MAREVNRKCQIRRTKDRPGRGPTHEVIAPDGYCFEPGLHVTMAWSLSDAEEQAKGPVYPCAFECDCQYPV